MKNLKDAIEARRSVYSLSSESPISDSQIQEIIEFAARHSPTSFNSQSGRVVLLLGKSHKKLWNIVKDALKAISQEALAASQFKIDNSFASGHGTILFFEDTNTVEALQQKFAAYADNFPVWSEQASGILQYIVWTMLAEAGLGASLQHYGNLISDRVAEEFNIEKSWKLIAQMPFGTPTTEQAEKQFMPISERVVVRR